MVKDKCLYVYINTEFGNDFLDMTPKAQATKENKEGTGLYSKHVCSSKNTFKKVKRQPTEWDIIFANDETDRVLISKI